MIFGQTGRGIALLGSVRAVDGKAVVRVEDRFSTDLGDLWSALTDPQRLARWLARVEGDLRPGGEFRATFTSGMEHVGRIHVCEPPRRLVVTTSVVDDDDGHETVIEALLAADGDHTRLVVEHHGLPLHEAGSHCAGWQANIEDLASYLTSGDRAADWHVRYAELVPAYREHLAR